MGYNARQKLTDNIAALRIALQHGSQGIPDPLQVEQLKRYSGFGGIRVVHFGLADAQTWKARGATEDDMRLYPLMQELYTLIRDNAKENIYPQVVESLQSSGLTAFYTPDFVPRALYAALTAAGIRPQHVMDPAAGAGVFLWEAEKAFDSLKQLTGIEKDMATGRVLHVLARSFGIPTNIGIRALESPLGVDDEPADLLVSNIPFGAIKVFDPVYTERDRTLTERIHNYFFAKGLDKVADGGLLAYITTDAFLNSPGNLPARQYLFERADFISLAVLPENLMGETGDTMAPCHLLIVQKREGKSHLSNQEEQLLNTVWMDNDYGRYPLNAYIMDTPGIMLGDTIEEGTNQYGEAQLAVRQRGRLSDIGTPLTNWIIKDLQARFNLDRFRQAIVERELVHDEVAVNVAAGPRLSLLPMPKQAERKYTGQQIGLFDTGMETGGRAQDYLTPEDERYVNRHSARLLGTIHTDDRRDHELAVVLAAKHRGNGRFLYKIFINAQGNWDKPRWMDAEKLGVQAERMSQRLLEFGHAYHITGEQGMKTLFPLTRDDYWTVESIMDHHKDGTLVIHQGRLATIGDISKDRTRARLNDVADQRYLSFYTDYIPLRDAYLMLMENDRAGREDIDGLRARMNTYYDQLVKDYGFLSTAENKARLERDPAYGTIIGAALERKVQQGYEKADVFTVNLYAPKVAFKTDDPLEALANCLNQKGRVDLGAIASVLSVDERTARNRLGDALYRNPGKQTWETADEYLSGNVVEKLRQALALQTPENNDPELQRSIQALQGVQPEIVPFDLLDFNLGERWIPVSYYERFAAAVFETKGKIAYVSSIDTFKVEFERRNAKLSQEFAIRPKSGRIMYGNSLFEHAMHDTAPFFTYEVVQPDGSKIRRADTAATQLAHEKIQTIRLMFPKWLAGMDDADKQALVDHYNDTFNCYRLRKYNGSHLKFPGLDLKALKIEQLYDSQRDGIWRLLVNRGGIIDHEVGLGKTLLMIIAAMEMRRLNLARKPMILAKKANVTQIADTFRKAYPNARILFPGKDDFTPKQRKRIFQEIKNNNWDCIILTHQQFTMIPQSPEIMAEVLNDELHHVDADLREEEAQGKQANKAALKGLRHRKGNLEVKLKEAQHRIEKRLDYEVDFRSMQVDHLFVDESQTVKNLTFTTRHNRVAGLGNPVGSQRALNMLYAIRELQSRFDSDLCVTFLSGTPISNSLTELYLLFKYLRPRELMRQGISNFDSWVAVFGRKTTDFELSVTNQVVVKERFKEFYKIPELATFYAEITDYKTAKHIGLDKPEIDEVLVNLPASEEQLAYGRLLIQFARTGDSRLLGRAPKPRENEWRMIIATTYAMKMATDMRLINPTLFGDHPGNKINACCSKVVEIYRQSMAVRGTQLVFCDLGTPGTAGFNLYEEILRKLIQAGIPRDEISFVHDWPDDNKREFFRRMNAGEIRVLVGSTEKLGIGNNIQERVVAQHDITIPWKPAEMEQRDGRGARQGNWVARDYYGNKVRKFIYATERSLDAYKFNVIKNKLVFINQLKDSSIKVRRIDEGGIDEKSGMMVNEYIAVLVGDQTLLQKSRLDSEVLLLENLRTQHIHERIRVKAKLTALEAEHDHLERTLERLKVDEADYRQVLRHEPDGSKSNPIRLYQESSADPEVIGRNLIMQYMKWMAGSVEGDEQQLGELYGFKLVIRHTVNRNSSGQIEWSQNKLLAISPKTGIQYEYNSGAPNIEHPKLAARYFLNAIDRCIDLREKYEKDLRLAADDIVQLKAMLEKPFEKEGLLTEKKAEAYRLGQQINATLQAIQLIDNDQTPRDMPGPLTHPLDGDVPDVKGRLAPLSPVKALLEAGIREGTVRVNRMPKVDQPEKHKRKMKM